MSPSLPCLGAACVVLLSSPVAALAQGSHQAPAANAPQASSRSSILDLRWEPGDTGCGGEAVAERALDLLAERRTAHQVAAHASIERNEAGLRVSLRTRHAEHEGSRVIQAGNCSEAQNAVALLLAMILEAEAEQRARAEQRGELSPAAAPRPSPAPRPPPPAAEPSQPEPPADSTDDRGEDEAAGMFASAQLHFLTDWRAVPGLGLGGGVRLGLGWDWIELALAGSATRGETRAREGLSADATRLSLQASVCAALWGSGPLAASACVGGGISRLASSTTRAEASPPDELPSFSPLGDDVVVRGHALAEARFTATIMSGLFVVVAPTLLWERRFPFVVCRRLASEEQSGPCPSADQISLYRSGPFPIGLLAGIGARF